MLQFGGVMTDNWELPSEHARTVPPIPPKLPIEFLYTQVYDMYVI